MNYLVIDVGGTFTKYALMNEDCEFLDKGRIPTVQAPLGDFIQSFTGIYDRYASQISGIALSMPGLIDPDSSFMYTGGSISCISNLNIIDILHQHCPVQITVGNDAKCAALAEIWKGSLQDCQNAIVMVIGTGVGGAIIQNRQVVNGRHFMAGELSYTMIGKEIPATIDDAFGFRSGVPGLIHYASESMHIPEEELDGKIIFNAANCGDAKALAALRKYAADLALQINNYRFILDPDKIAIGGGISAQPLLLQLVKEELQKINDVYAYWKIPMPEIVKKFIAPELHSQFIEFLGNCISDGIWVGKDSPIPNYNGLRKDVVDALKNLQPPVVRWPGGCYADMYHWRDGIGKDRRITWNENFGTYTQEKNEFGTHEFMDLCHMIGAKPWLNINMLRGTVAETVEWAEYCNRREETSLSRERAENGSPEPFNVEYWGLGNECWAGGGNYTAQGYADEYRKYASFFPAFKPMSLDGSADGINMKFIACGPDGNKPVERVKWTKDFFRALADYRRPQIDAMDLHFYNWNTKDWQQPETEFNADEWYQVLYGAMELEDVILEQSKLIAEGIAGLPDAEGDFPAPPADCRLIVGEWGNWRGKAFLNRPALYQQCTMRDALTTAITLDIFHRNSDLVSMACVAQTVNVLNSLILTEGEKFVLTPNYYVFEMYKPHRGGHVLELQSSGEMACERTDARVPNIYSFASEKDGIITVNLINANLTEEHTVELTLPGKGTCLSGKVLNSEKATDYNSFDNPDCIVPESAAVPESTDGKTWSVTVPAASVSVYQFASK